MAYATWDDYTGVYLLGRDPQIPEGEFAFWERKASERVDKYTYGRLTDVETREAHRSTVIPTVCELAEYYYLTEDNIGKTSQGVAGASVAYDKDEDRRIVRAHLIHTGLLYAGVYPNVPY